MSLTTHIIVMGVSGCGKTTLGAALAAHLDWPFFDADDFHPPANVEKMKAGEPLTDADRAPWLERLNHLLQTHPHAVLACSALKEKYRQVLTASLSSARFAHPHGAFDIIASRIEARSQATGHYMPVSLLQSQFDTLEMCAQAVMVDIALPRHARTELVLQTLTPFQAINWNANWLMPYKAVGMGLAKAIASGSPVHAALNEALDSNPDIDCPVRFVPQEESQGAGAYESFIWQTQTVPTRDNLHDFFNGLVWLHFPKIKARLNELQAAAIEAAGVTQHRGKLRDALTLFDENAAFLIESKPEPVLLQAIQDKAWQHVFIDEREAWRDAQLIIFGHALLEKLVSPRKAMTAHVFCPPAPLHVMDDADIDRKVASMLAPEHLATKPYAPLPVMGVPDWCLENEQAAFYDDAAVFRSPLNSQS